MMIRMKPQRVETSALLAWLSAMLKKCEGASVELVIVDGPGRGSSVQITVRDVPGPLAGLQVQPSRDG